LFFLKGPEMKTFCYHCGNVFDVLDSDQGKEIECPHCRKAFYADVCDEFRLPAAPGLVSGENKVPRWDLTVIERVSRTLATFNAIFPCMAFLASVVWAISIIDRNFPLAVAVLIGSCVQLTVMFSIAWGLLAVSEIISQTNISNLGVRR
jgi:hypothetical protein